MNTHKLTMPPAEFARYFFGATNKIQFFEDSEVMKGDMITMIESAEVNQKDLGRRISFIVEETEKVKSYITDEFIIIATIRRLNPNLKGKQGQMKRIEERE